MLTYKYVAKDPSTGEKIKSEVQAANEQVAAKLISKQGLSPLEIELKEESQTSSFLSKFSNRVPIKDKVLFSRQLSTLINAGLPLVQSLRNVASQTRNKYFQSIITKVITDVEAGNSFSDSLSKHPKIFSDIFINLVAAGEVSGTLDKSLERLANQQEKDAEILSKVRGAMVYPIVVLIVMAGVVAFMVIKVLPAVEELYEGLGGTQKLPLITKILLWFSRFVTHYWWILLIITIIGGFFLTRWMQTLGGKSFADKFKMKAWPFGPLFMKLYMARFARTGATLVAAGVPLIQTLDIIGKSVNNVHIEASLKRAIDKVQGGKSLADSLEGDPNFLQLVPNMLHIGEESGSMEQMLEKTADYYEKEVDNEIKTISTIIEPLLMIILGVMAFIVVAAILMPIYGLAGQTIIK